MTWKLTRAIIAAFILFASSTCFAAVDDSSATLIKVYDRAMSFYKEGNAYAAYSELDSFFNVHDYADFTPSFSKERYSQILNDYAFFMEKYYESQATNFCTKHDSSYHDFMTFHFSILDDVKDILEYVIKLNPERKVAYLNLADVLYELDSDEEADAYYKKYAKLMGDNSASVPKRVFNDKARKKYHLCH